LLALFAVAGCASGQKRIPPKHVYRALYYGSTDGSRYVPVLSLVEQGERAKPSCRGIDRKTQVKAQYLVERKDSGITLTLKDCESTPENCSKLTECLKLRPVPWLARAAGRTNDDAGTIYTDWIGRCGGQLAVNFYYGPESPLPVEKVGCTEPKHDTVDTAYEMLLVPRFDIEQAPAAAPIIERLLERWDAVVFHEIESVPPPAM
jgi:hypothetical protein